MQRASRTTTDPLALLQRCDPVRLAPLSSDEIGDVLDELGASITSRSWPPSRRRQRRRMRRIVLAAAVVLLALGVGIATATVVLSAHTGRFPTGAEVTMGGPGEELDPSAPDFRQVAVEIASDIPYPDGYASWRDFLISDEIDTDASDHVLLSTGALHGWFAASAFCAWVQAWRQAVVAGDSAGAKAAAATIAQAPGWTAVTDEDPHPDPAAANDPGAEPGTLFGWLLPYRAAVLAGERARVEHLLATGYGQGKCWSSDPEWMAQLRAHPDWGRLGPDELAQKYQQFLASGRS